MGHGYPGVAITDCCYQTYFVGRRDACVADCGSMAIVQAICMTVMFTLADVLPDRALITVLQFPTDVTRPKVVTVATASAPLDKATTAEVMSALF
ncbi:MAG: hypothetical protein F4207_02735 [Gemmatimonadetes bacterium]|nr:hypothetical protein [Gemmatimonadota bacterium]